MKEYIYSLMTDKKSGFVASVLKFALYLLSLLYLLAIKIIFALRRRGLLLTAHLSARLISIGNLTFGGTGKTPLVELTAKYLLEMGKKAVVLTRGYKADDEPALLRLKLPRIAILVGPDRIKNGKLAISNYGADILLLDDGFQCWELSREIDILTIDATNPFGNEKLLPRGILREPVSSLARANIVVITKTDAATPQATEAVKRKVRSINPQALIVLSMHKPSKIFEFSGREKSAMLSAQDEGLQLDWLGGKEFVAVSGIGDPAYFKKTLQDLGVVIKADIVFEDHRPYSFNDLVGICNKCRQVSAKRVITTEKDMIKLKPLIATYRETLEGREIEFFALAIELELLENRDKFIEWICSYTP